MAATTYAMLGQYSGSSWDAAFPQSPQGGTLNQDLIHIRGIGNAVIAVINHAGVVSGGTSSSYVLTQATVNKFTLTSVAVAGMAVQSVVGATAVYTVTATGAATNALIGKTVVVTGLVASAGANNGTLGPVTANDATTFTVARTTQVDETAVGVAGVVGLTAVTYTGTITGGATPTNAYLGKSTILAGFAAGSGINNVTAIPSASTATTIVVPFTAQIAETHAGTAQVAGVSTTSYAGTITDGGTNNLAGSTAVFAGFAASTGANNLTAVILSNTTTAIVVRTTAQVNETHAGTAAISLAYVPGGSRIGTFKSRLDNTASRAAVFADAFTNLALQDIIQVVSPAGQSVVSYVDYLGISH
jgi:hypothetical protein